MVYIHVVRGQRGVGTREMEILWCLCTWIVDQMLEDINSLCTIINIIN